MPICLVLSGTQGNGPRQAFFVTLRRIWVTAMAKNLTQIALDSLKPGDKRREVPDGKESGLYLIVQPTGRMAWALRYRFEGKPKKFTLGPYPEIGLAKARALAGKGKASIADGIDPGAAKAAAKEGKQETGRDVVEKVVES